MKTIKQLIGIIMLLTIVWSCEGPEGPEGPIGKTGDNGKGIKGDDGEKGDPGINGNANVTTETFFVKTTVWDLSSNSNFYYCDVDPAKITYITDDIVKNGFVKIFMSYNDSIWINMPYTDFYSGYSINYNYLYKADFVRLLIVASNGFVYLPADTLYFKIIAIAGTAVSTINPKIDFNNYSVIQKYFPSVNKSVSLIELEK